MRHMRYSRRLPAGAVTLLCCTLLSLLPACQPNGPDPAFDRYLDTLGAALSLHPPGSQNGRVIPPPPPNTMQLNISASSLGGLDILTLRGCAVQRNIIRRDSSLGRLAKPSQQLLLTLEYLRLAPPCIQRLRGRNDALAGRLRKAWQLQQEQLPALIFNATLGGDEFAAFWRAAPVPRGYPRVSARETASAVQAIAALANRWLDGDYRAQDREFELWLAAIAGGTGGARWEAVSRQGDALEAANRMLTRRGVSAMRCGASNVATLNPGLPAKLRSAFLRDVQPRYLRSLLRYRQLLHPIAGLEGQLDAVLPQPYRHWMEDRSQRFNVLVSAPQRHLLQLDEYLRACATN